MAAAMRGRDIRLFAASPLERAIEAARPLAGGLGLDMKTDARRIESENVSEGEQFDVRPHCYDAEGVARPTQPLQSLRKD